MGGFSERFWSYWAGGLKLMGGLSLSFQVNGWFQWTVLS